MPSHHAVPSRGLRFVKALVALAGMAILLVGIPVALWEFGQLPQRWTSPAEWGAVLMQPDDGSLLVSVLTVAGWLLWAWLALPLLVETGALLTRRVAPRLPGLATPQRLASYLVGALLAASPVAASAATPAAAAVAAVPHSDGASHPDNSSSQAADTAAREDSEPVHRVTTDNPTLWGIAKERLGDGSRWKDIQALNPGLEQGEELPEGTVLKMPSDTPALKAQTSKPRGQGEAAGEKPETYTVESGDTLWGVADSQLGDPTKWRQIAEDNRDVVSDPNVIHPGDKLALPSQQATPPGQDTPPPPPEKKPQKAGRDQLSAYGLNWPWQDFREAGV
ncbi:LysM peptidoglycan-binding domain-containing protein [Streptomyces sp. CA-250714]|uniref:LysM peptidoglycan-binding domain-containing protein n=1 Tax=Streptomyces sp. CA-250714 TaxID=3240060 RepID=UPI003D8A8A1B